MLVPLPNSLAFRAIDDFTDIIDGSSCARKTICCTLIGMYVLNGVRKKVLDYILRKNLDCFCQTLSVGILVEE